MKRSLPFAVCALVTVLQATPAHADESVCGTTVFYDQLGGDENSRAIAAPAVSDEKTGDFYSLFSQADVSKTAYQLRAVKLGSRVCVTGTKGKWAEKDVVAVKKITAYEEPVGN